MDKLQALGARVVACSDSNGVVHEPDGIDLDVVKRIKEVERGRLEGYGRGRGRASYHAQSSVWGIPCEIALPCATQNELDERAARTLIENGCFAVAEGANMPTTPEATRVFIDAGIAFGPGKAANAGCVATSALEMQQNASRDAWTFEFTEQRLREIMRKIHEDCYAVSEEYGKPGSYVIGANIAGFQRVARAMLAFGVI
jgi:glutamate dehydrogenase (NADP+)